jgi:hypothetical protein
VAADQGGPSAAGGGQSRKEGKYTLDATLDQPCKFHSNFWGNFFVFILLVLIENLQRFKTFESI